MDIRGVCFKQPAPIAYTQTGRYCKVHVLLPLVPERRRGEGVHWKEVKDKDTEPSEKVIHSEVKKRGKKYVYAKLVSREMLTEKSSSLFSIDTEALRELPRPGRKLP